MKIDRAKVLGVMAVAGVVAISGCRQKDESAGVGERTGAVLDRAAEKTVDVATNVAAKTAEVAKEAAVATKDATGKAVEKTGEAMERAGEAVEETGAGMQK